LTSFRKEKQARKQDEEEIDVTAFLADNYRIFKPEQISYKVADVTNMEEYEDGSIDVVLDKGMLDAVLSHGEVETGDNEIVQQVNREIYRVLKPGGVWLVFSGNGSIITTPYFCGDEGSFGFSFSSRARLTPQWFC
jgi:predicted methyltransferase